MKELNRKSQGIHTYGQQLFMTIGIVKNNADPAHHGRLQIYCPNIDAEDFAVKDLPWAWYIAPFGGTTANPLIGREQTAVEGITTYGMWAIPKNGSQVLVGFLDGNAENRFYLGAMYLPEQNRTLPAGIDDDGMKTEIDESGNYGQNEFETYKKNQTEAGLYKDDPHYRTRGSYERSVSHPSNKNKVKPTDNGYYPKPLEPEKADSQIYSWTTPGRHYITMSDVDEYCRIRIRSTEGNQVIIDDTNERIYISTAKGRNWIEIDEGSGKIYFYTASKFNIHSENDLNLYSDENINIVAKKRVNIQSEERAVKIQSKRNTEILSTDANIKLTASRDLSLRTTGGPKAEAIPEKMWCTKPPYAGEPLGLRRDYAEEAGSTTSKIFINSAEGMELRADKNNLKVTAKEHIELRSISNSIKLMSSSSIDFKAKSLNQEAASINILGGSTSISAGTLNLLGGQAKLTGAAKLELYSYSIIEQSETVEGGSPALPATPAGSADIAEQAKKVEFDKIKAKMIVPLHEKKPYTRDEDEGNCKTPRNKKYQG